MRRKCAEGSGGGWCRGSLVSMYRGDVPPWLCSAAAGALTVVVDKSVSRDDRESARFRWQVAGSFYC